MWLAFCKLKVKQTSNFMEWRVKYRMKAGLKIVGVFLFVVFLASCSSYKVLDIDVLHPGKLNIGNKNARILFIDRKLVHELDSLSAYQLFTSLRLRRNEVVNYFYNGVRDGLRNGIQPILLIKGLGLNTEYIPNEHIPAPISREGIAALEKISGQTHVLSVEYCKFGLDDANRLILDSNLFVRLYDPEGVVVDSATTHKLDDVDETLFEGNSYDIICNFFYNNGIKYAERLTPTWKPEQRRIYTNNRLLNLGYYHFENENDEEARRIWNAALNLKPKVAARAAVNLAWFYEKDGNFSSAKALLEAALKTLQANNISDNLSVYIADYIKRLEKRIKDETKIMEQL